MRAIALLAVLLVTAPALAENAELTAARQAFDDVDFERVIPLLEKALAAGPTDAEKVEIFVLMGQVHMAYGRTWEAEHAFVEALTLERSYTLPETVAPKISAAFEKARSLVPIPASAPMGPLTPPEEREDPTEPDGYSVLHQWWLWAIVGGVVAGTGGIVAWQLAQPSEPAHDYKFKF